MIDSPARSRISIIAALAENRVIGKDNALPWRLPEDWRRFKSLTRGHAIIMGRRTFESIGKPLPDRRHIVVSRNRNYCPAGIEVVPNLDQAILLALDDAEIFIGGGEQIYGLVLSFADRMYLTRIHAVIDGDTFFPPFKAADWTLTKQQRHAADEKNPYGMTFEQYDRKTGSRLEGQETVRSMASLLEPRPYYNGPSTGD